MGGGEEEGRDVKEHGVCGQAFPLLPSPSPFHFKFALAAPFYVITRLETPSTQTKALLACENRRLFQLLFRKLYTYIYIDIYIYIYRKSVFRFSVVECSIR